MIGFKTKTFGFYIGHNNTISGEPFGFWIKRWTGEKAAGRYAPKPCSFSLSVGIGPGTSHRPCPLMSIHLGAKTIHIGKAQHVYQ